MEIEIDDSGTTAAGAKQSFETQTFRAPEEISGSSTAANERFGIAHEPSSVLRSAVALNQEPAGERLCPMLRAELDAVQRIERYPDIGALEEAKSLILAKLG